MAHLRVPVFLVFLAATARAQTSAGVTAGTAKLSDTRTEAALTAILQYQPRPWLTLSALPAFVHVTDQVTGGTTSTSGLGDLPLVAGAAHSFVAPWTPTLGAAAVLTLPTGDAACGLGAGDVSLSGALGVTVAPGYRWRVTASASRRLAGLAAQSSLAAPQATWLSAGAAWAVTNDWIASAAFNADVGTDSTTPLSRSLGAGVSYRIAGPLAVTLDVSRGLTSASPPWVVSVGFGTVFSGISPVAPEAPARRLSSSFGGGVSRGNGGAKTGC